MMDMKIIRYISRICVSCTLFVPVFAWSAVSDPGQLVQQATKFSATSVATAPREEMVSQLMVKPRYRAGDSLNVALHARDARGLVKISNVSMSVVRPMSGGTHVISLDQPVTLSEARVIAARLMGDSSVELAEPDRHKRPLALTPSDPDYLPYQWNLFTPTSSKPGSANLPDAWSISTGSNTVTVAVIDTGYRPHADLGNVILPGYDFIGPDQNSNPPTYYTANDGNGRDADALDPGDWINSSDLASGHFPGCTSSDIGPSSWHGTHVSGIIAAQMNTTGIAGIAPHVQILPVRVLGKCGGFDSDIIDAMRWAAGIAVTGVPANPYPAQVLNMSLGGTSTTCSQTYQSAVSDVINAGKVIVVAAGNDTSSQLKEPANCPGVIAVTANNIDGDNAYYATIGPGTTISAPGGGCGGFNYPSCPSAKSIGIYSLLNSGATNPVASPGGDTYGAYDGTSMAAPHVSAVVALMFSVNPSLTPAQIISYLQSSARSFPANTICTQTKNLGLCGAGLLDAYQALNAVKAASPPPVVTLGSIPAVVSPGDTVTLSGSAVVSGGWSIASYAWTQISGPGTALINNANSATASFTAPANTGTYSFMLTATDNRTPGQTGTKTAVLVVNTPPVLTTVPAQTITAGQTLNFTVTATDTDGDTPIFHSVLLPAGATLSAAGSFSWPNSGPAGNYTLTYYASDTYNAVSPNGSVNITVSSVPAGSTGGSSGGGGGGSMDTTMLAVLALLALGLRLWRRHAGDVEHLSR